jgi:hypothetical protein
VRGKHGNAAKNRRERAELEQHAESAERRAERAERELAELRASSQRLVTSLRAEVSAVRDERDRGVSPVLEAERERAEKLLNDLGSARSELAEADSLMRNYIRTVMEQIDAHCISPEQRKQMSSAVLRTMKEHKIGLRVHRLTQAELLRSYAQTDA